MARKMSRRRRKEAFLIAASEAFERLEDWYDEHPEATFGEFEQEARQCRRELMGQALAVLINGRDNGVEVEGVHCEQCEVEMAFKGYLPWTVRGLEGDTRLERAYYVCPECEGETFFPLDRKLALRQDHWSEGAAQVATEQGLQAASFAGAAAAYRNAVGGAMSRSSVRRITEGFGAGLAEWKAQEAKRATAIAAPGEEAQERRVAMREPIEERGNISSDGTMILVRGEGWKEVKMATFSQVEVLEPEDRRRRAAQRAGKRAHEEVVRLSAHSYCAGLWDAETFEPYQYAEGLRRGLDQVAHLSSVNDGAPWIVNRTFTNFPEAEQVIDWHHATQRLWAVAHAVHGEGQAAEEWETQREEELWHGAVDQVIQALTALPLNQADYPAEVGQAANYFRHNRDRMRYDVFRALGYPIGSGTVESDAKNVVKHRMRRPGPGWNRNDAQSMLAALTEFHSQRFEWAWQMVYPSAA